MTRAEIRIAAAKKRYEKAEATRLAIYHAKEAAAQAAHAKWNKRYWAAQKLEREAKSALRTAELAARGITPMRTICSHKGGLVAALVTSMGWVHWLPVSPRTLRILRNRCEVIVSDRNLTVTDKEMIDG